MSRRGGEAQLTASRDAPLGGQAVLEGVMMRGISTWAVAVRKPGAGAGALGGPTPGPIDVQSFPLVAWTKRRRIYRWPVIRGVVALVESLAIGLRALGISANAQLPEEEQQISSKVWGGTIVVALAFSIGLFFVVPVGVTSLIKDQLGSPVAFWAVEGVLRTSIFLGYLVLLSRLPDLRRVFEYHGAEHKVISCYEAEDELTPARAKLYSRLHPRCGTSFLLLVMIVAIFVFAPIGLPAWWLLVITRIVGVPLIAGLSFELIKWAGRNRRRPWVRAVMWPGMQLQKLTTREPDLSQLEVSIAALNAVLAVEGAEARSSDDLVGVEVVA
ncbi:MAG TPA: DUF1385 domain-containing protein [Solirubrobacteraceae bacterium]|jgi:uncharacterized protein YqhQ